MKEETSIRNRESNAQGKIFERMIVMACEKYAMIDKAFINKIPEDFHPTKIDKEKKRATGYYKEKAQPDFQGTLKGGQSISFEAKSTREKKMNQSTVTKTQAACLDQHEKMGAVVGICCLINKTAAFVPWADWKNMKELFGRKHITEDEVKKYRVPTRMYIDFLYDFVPGGDGIDDE